MQNWGQVTKRVINVEAKIEFAVIMGIAASFLVGFLLLGLFMSLGLVLLR